MKTNWLLLVLIVALHACQSEGVDRAENPTESSEELPELIPSDTTLVFELGEFQVNVDVRFPDSNWIGTMILLQGWNFPNNDWCDKTQLCEKALKEGYALVCPDMGKSIYALQTYPETRKDWLMYPTRTWVNDELIPDLNNKKYLLKEKFNCAVGLSTGARGAFFLALDYPELFQAVACLSGDYDQRLLPQDNLYRGYFGSMENFPDRWSENENPMTKLNQLNAAVYLAHGLKDEVVDPICTKALAENLGNADYKIVLDENGGHDYVFWGAQVDSILAFLSKSRVTNNM